jgi:cytidine deaminase
MKKRILKTAIEVYASEKELSLEDQKLIKKARKALEKSYSPYSNFKVGAAILLKNGKMMSGSNQENASYPLCLCAERVTIAAADSVHPKVPILALAITAKSPSLIITNPVAPCGACRQVIFETEMKHQTSMRILLQGEKGKVYVIKGGKDLLPLSFDGSLL